MTPIQIIEQLAKEKTAWSKELQSFVDIQKNRTKSKTNGNNKRRNGVPLRA